MPSAEQQSSCTELKQQPSSISAACAPWTCIRNKLLPSTEREDPALCFAGQPTDFVSTERPHSGTHHLQGYATVQQGQLQC